VSNERILVVDDEPDIRRLVQEILEDEGYHVRVAEDAARARKAVDAERPDLVLLDIWLPDTDGITLLKEWSGGGRPEMPVVMMSGHGTVETAVEATRLGAYDFVEKPVSLGKLLVTCKRALQAEHLRLENLHLRRGLGTASELVGSSETMRRLRDTIARVAATDAWVLITGEAGSGKAVAARYLHRRSNRADQPFVEISLGAIPAAAITTQLFGSEHEGVVTPGSFEQASGGTLLLDEVSEIDRGLQAKLLRVLQEHEFERVGSSVTRRVDVRVIATTNRDLRDWAARAKFREDLYYRLSVLPIEVPPLRERREDIPLLLEAFVSRISAREGRERPQLTSETVTLLTEYSWPGNVRELQNLCERVCVLEAGREVGPNVIRPLLTGPIKSASMPVEKVQYRDGQILADAERHLIMRTLRRFDGHRERTARALGIGLRTLGLKIKRWREEGTYEEVRQRRVHVH
jgi:two-component system nitrogen regulation response regulator NtrX